ncbi:MAG: globin [Nocardioidaceae bacterium]
MTTSQQRSFYDEVGGHDTFVRIVSAFYAGVAADPELRALYPEEDLGPAEERLRMFLEQFWGGPSAYSEQRGHPRLGMRHATFAVTPRARDLWLGHMQAALDQAAMSPEHTAQFWSYVVRAAHFLVNRPEEEPAVAGDDSALLHLEATPPSA